MSDGGRQRAIDWIAAELATLGKEHELTERVAVATRLVDQIIAAAAEEPPKEEEPDMTAMPRPEQIGEIVSKADYRYRMTQTDLLWLARAVQYEGGNEAATIWTYAQRAALVKTSSLTSLLRGHSQPINPLWDEADDERCMEHPDRCTPAHLERRERAASMPWESIDASVRDLVVRFARGTLPNPVPKAVDFADAAVSRSFMARTPGSYAVLKDGNWYLATAKSHRWSAGYVRVVAPESKSSIYIVGDSHVEALGPRLSRLLTTDGWEVLGFTFNRGWSTERYITETGANRLATVVVREGLPDAVLVCLGGNDRPSSIDGYRRQLSEAVGMLANLGVRIYWAGPSATSPAADDAIARWHMQNALWQKEILPDLGVTWIDSRALTRSGQQADGVHFSSAGYDRWAAGLATVLPSRTRANPLLGLTPFGQLLHGLISKA